MGLELLTDVYPIGYFIGRELLACSNSLADVNSWIVPLAYAFFLLLELLTDVYSLDCLVRENS